MRLDQEIVITLDGKTIRLRPTLRAAYRLEKEFGGFDNLYAGLVDCSLTAVKAVIRASDQSSNAGNFLDLLADRPLRAVLEIVMPPLLEHVGALIGFDPNFTGDSASGTISMTFAEYHDKLFRIGTGWLGWTPEETWNASPDEIIEAYKGRCEMLRAIFGGQEPDRPKASFDDQLRATMTSVIARKRAQRAA